MKPALAILIIMLLPCHALAMRYFDFHDWHHAMSDLREPVLRRSSPVADLPNLLERVNAEVNRMPYANDFLVYGKPHYWATEREFVNFGGECRDFVAEKYRLLRRAGVADADMRVAVVTILKSGEVHAVLVVSHEGKRYILENPQAGEKVRAVQTQARLQDFEPIYTINRLAWSVAR